MHRAVVIVAVVAAGTLTVPAEAQFSSDIPGVPRASVPFRGNHQNRTEWTFAGYKIPGAADVGDTTALGVRVTFGRSYRIRNVFELGFDISIIDGLLERPPEDTLPGAPPGPGSYIRGSGFYGLRIGGKWRPFSALDLDGYGWEGAIGAGVQPSLRPLIGAESYDDSTRFGGQFSGEAEPGLRGSDPFGRIHMATFLSGMASYRSQRILADVALVAEAVRESDEADGPSPLVKFDGVSPRGGVMYRLTPSLALGASYWGNGAPPWRDQISVGVPGAAKGEHYGFIMTLGSRPESGTDFMVSTPTGDWGQSVRLYIRGRSTR
ncbi:MAG: hypothetical protein WEB88_13800 [Gemmatimonadota bacterium]